MEVLSLFTQEIFKSIILCIYFQTVESPTPLLVMSTESHDLGTTYSIGFV